MGQRVNPLRVAAVQDAPVFLDRDATLDKTLTLVERAAGTGAQLVVFPEAFIAGYPDWVWRTTPVDEHASALYARLFDNAVVVGSAVTQVLGLAAQRYGVYLSIGITERETVGSTLYATQLLFGPDGRCSRFTGNCYRAAPSDWCGAWATDPVSRWWRPRSDASAP